MSGSSAFAGVGGTSSAVLAPTVVSLSVSASSEFVTVGGVSVVSGEVVFDASGDALNTMSDCLRGVGALNSERASVQSVMVIHLSERALITVIVYASPASRVSTRVT